MKRMRYSEEQVTSILNEREAGSLGGRLGPHARHRRAAGPPLEVEVRWHVGTRPQAAQGRELAPEAHGPGPGPGPCGRSRTSSKCQKSTDARRQEEGGGPAPEGPPGQRLGPRGARGCGGLGPRRARRPDRTGAGRPASRSSQLANGRRIRIGPETASKAMRFWSERSGAALDFIQPGKPTQNAFAESFDGKLRDSCLKALVHGPRRRQAHRGRLGVAATTMNGRTARLALNARRAGQASRLKWHPPLGKWTCFRGRPHRLKI